MAKQKNENIGHIVCGFQGCTEIAAVRRDSGGRLYTVCLDCGRGLSPRGAAAQDRILSNAQIWPADGPGGKPKPPAGVPRWIGEGWSWQRATLIPEQAKEIPGGARSRPKPTPRKRHEPPPSEPPRAAPKAARAQPGGQDLPPPPPPPQPEPQPAEAAPEQDPEPRGFSFMEF